MYICYFFMSWKNINDYTVTFQYKRKEQINATCEVVFDAKKVKWIEHRGSLT